jgi:N-methylhydantoinase A/oxoprolinase/acetone carboxylase beta subunit
VRLGVDVGGTNADVAIINRGEILGSCKALLQNNIAVGIKTAIHGALATSNITTDKITAIVVGTTHFTNAAIEGRRLQPAAILRICRPSNQDLEPMTDWPPDLAKIAGRHIYLVRGGYEFDGREIVRLDDDEIRRAAHDMRRKRLSNIAVSCIFSTVNDEMELRAGQILAAEIPGARITLSSRLGRFGLIDRENAALLNASLSGLGAAIIETIAEVLGEFNIEAPFYLSQNDGSLMSPKHAASYPVLTYASGPANSIRGAAYLTGLDNAIVMDIGGTTTDVGELKKGLPRNRVLPKRLAGIRTNFRMPDLVQIGLGGGSIVRLGANPTVGPDSVGYELSSKAMVFGGNVLTATDIAVAVGRMEIGDPALVSHLSREDVKQIDALIQTMIADAIDQMKTSAAPLPIILVGGGRGLASRNLPGAGKILIPDHADVANAIGAAFALVSGEAEQQVDYNVVKREAAIETVKQRARRNAITAGADPETLREVEVDETPLPYSGGGLIRVRIVVVGDLLNEDHA